MPLHREPPLPAERILRFFAFRTEGVGNVTKHVAVAVIPEILIDLFGDKARTFVLSGGAERHYIKAIEVQTLAPRAEKILPIGAFLHADQSALIDILAGIPIENGARSGTIRREKRTTDNPPKAGIGIGTKVRTQSRTIYVIGNCAAHSLFAAKQRDAGVQSGLDLAASQQTRTEQRDHTVARPDLVMADPTAGGFHARVGGAQ